MIEGEGDSERGNNRGRERGGEREGEIKLLVVKTSETIFHSLSNTFQDQHLIKIFTELLSKSLGRVATTM